MTHSDYPPDTFHRSNPVFRPTEHFEQVEGFNEKLFKLVHETRFRSAMDEIFEILEKEPMHNLALTFAMLIAGNGRTEGLRAKEPLTLAYINDRRLDPVMAVCTQCERWWIPQAPGLLGMFGQLSTLNPVGLQCYHCGYVLCRNCFGEAARQQGIDTQLNLSALACPHCGERAFKTPVYPTGRQPRQMLRRPEPVLHVVVYREGPIQPDMEYMADVLASCCPDALEDHARATAVPVFPWPELPDYDLIGQAHAQLKNSFRAGEFPTRPDHVDSMLFMDPQGNNLLVVKLMLPPEETAELNSVIEQRYDQIVAENQEDPRLEATAELVERLKARPLRGFTMQSIYNQIDNAMQDQESHFALDVFGDLAIVVLAIPQLARGASRNHVGQHTIDHMRQLVGRMVNDPTQVHIAAWLAHQEGHQRQLFFNLIPGSPEIVGALGVGMEEQETMSPGCLFWFHWPTISDEVSPMYGRYVYQQILPHFVPQNILDFSPAFFFDGDCVPRSSPRLVMQTEEDKACLERVLDLGVDECFMVAIFGEPKKLEQLHRLLQSNRTVGYLGKVSCPGYELEEFYNLTGEFSLVAAAHVSGELFEKFDFGYLRDGELAEMGFSPADNPL